MRIHEKIKQSMNKVFYPNTWSSEAFVNHLRKTGCKIGENVNFPNPKSVLIDPNRRSFISIGNNVIITHNVQIVAHDFSWIVLVDAFCEFLPSGGGHIRIGDNVFIGFSSIICRGVTIGNNVIIGAGSIVISDIPDNSVVAGNPAHIIYNLDEYLNKRKALIMNEAIVHAKKIFEQKKEIPTLNDMGWFAFLFLDKMQNIPSSIVSNRNNTDILKAISNTSVDLGYFREFILENLF